MMIMRCLLINPVYIEPTQTICNKECTNVLQIPELCNPIANLENMRFQEAKKILCRAYKISSPITITSKTRGNL